MDALADRAARRRFLKPFLGEAISPPPMWLMRQAGRYLPEYRETRKTAGSFLQLCYAPDLAAEVTFQPIRRYGFDASILFSDILVVPDALGQEVRFVEGEGPRLDPIDDEAGLATLDPSATGKVFGTVCETVKLLRAGLPDETALIGFCGAPWTVATYVVGGRGSPDQAAARGWAYRDPAAFQKLIDILTDASIDYLSQQVEAGADVLQIFDSWAGSLADDQFDRWVVDPTRRMVEALKAKHPETPILGFPRAANAQTVRFVRETKVDGVSCDTSMPVELMAEIAQSENVVVQGNLDPLLLVAGGDALDARVRHIVQTMKGKRFIFNLGHGIVPQTPPENVERLVQVVREKC
ncbi:MAG: uroporphyrinogen decarboxylase [Pseudomonadota bacterium]